MSTTTTTTATAATAVTPGPSTARTLAELGERVAVDGPAAHHLLLEHLAALVADTAPAAAGVLTDTSAPTVVRERALAVASAALLRRAEESGPGVGTPFGLAA